MAEGGPLPENQVSDDNSHLSACQLSECPICLEQMREPKSLPCLHSFCEECLGTYIVTDLSGEMAAVTSFPCPVCRKITSPVNLSESKEMWAQQFPTNSLAQKFNIRKGMTDSPLYCGFCKKTKQMETPAKWLCKTKGMLFCDLCKSNAHDFFHEVCDISIIDETNHDVIWKQPLSTTCSTHNEKIDCYCEDHKLIGCNKCIIRDHRRCDVVMTSKEYCDKQKSNSKLDSMYKYLDKAANSMELMLKAFDDQVESMQECQDVGFSSITDLRERINLYLDKKQEEITQDMIVTCKAQKAKVDSSKQKCSRLRTAVQNTQEASRTAIRLDDSIETLQLFLRGHTEIVACDDLIDDIMHSSKLVSMKHDIDTSLTTIDQTSTLSMGRILVEEQPCILPDGVEYIHNGGMLFNSRVRKLGTCTIKIPSDRNCTGHGVLLMPYGNIVVCDNQNDKLKLFSFKERCLDELTINGYPHDLCLVDDCTVAVAVSTRQVGIHVVKVQSCTLTLSTVIHTPGGIQCYGIAFLDGKFMVSTPSDIHRVTMEGEAEKVHTLRAQCQHLASNPNKNHTYACLETSTADDIVVTRLPTGIQIYGLDGRVVKTPMGVDADREGNVYICGQTSNNVVQVSPYGTKIRELMTSKDGIVKPRAISVCGDKIVITNESSEHRNSIQVYQLY